jgi:hypothetical protein|tara:strand:+ start:13134 stop:13436 length:303 start_codon:yes stop_codon:yes gene_type:complete
MFRFGEDKILDEVLTYIASTYKGHYVGEAAGDKKEDIQTIDVWKTLGSLDTTSRDTSIKYLMRYGKKEGYNKKDLLKAIHYIILLWHATQDEPTGEKAGL